MRILPSRKPQLGKYKQKLHSPVPQHTHTHTHTDGAAGQRGVSERARVRNVNIGGVQQLKRRILKRTTLEDTLVVW